MSFKSLATGVLLVTAGFVLGAVYSNWTYDYYMLWVSPTPVEKLDLALQHYTTKAQQPQFLHHVLHSVFLLGGLSACLKLFRATESNTLFDGGSLFLIFICVVFYITNLFPARHSLLTGDWGDIDSETGVKFISASQILMVFCIVGVLMLQFGQWWAGDEQQQYAAALEQHKAAEKKAAEQEASEAAAAAPDVAEGTSSQVRK